MTDPGPKRSKFEREEQLVEIARWYAQGLTQAGIAEKLGLSRQQISYDLKTVRARWQEASNSAEGERIASELAKIDNLEARAWEEFEERKDLRCFGTVQWCIDRRVKLFGLDKPIKVDFRHALLEEAKKLGLSEEEAVAAAEEWLREQR